MGWFGLIATTVLVDAVVIAILYFIFNIVYNASSSSRPYSVISFIVSVIMFIILLCNKEGPRFEDGSFNTGDVGLIAVTSIALIFPITNAMIGLLEGEDVFQGIGQSIIICGGCMVVSIIILCFAQSFWPLVVLTGVGAFTSVVTFIRNE